MGCVYVVLILWLEGFAVAIVLCHSAFYRQARAIMLDDVEAVLLWLSFTYTSVGGFITIVSDWLGI